MTPTTGVKGTIHNIKGCITALDIALTEANLNYHQISQIHINQAAPVISDLSMDTISETTVIDRQGSDRIRTRRAALD